jgi:nucleoside-diphosphate-sugar epimerase
MAGAVKRLFIFGAGYAGREIARQAISAGWKVAGTSRTPEKVAELAQFGIEAELFVERTYPPSTAFREASHFLFSIPPDAWGDTALQQFLSCLGLCVEPPKWMGYLSTTGVYGDTAGAWVDETSQPNPGQQRSRRRLAAERAWQAAGGGLGIHIFRLPAIYGPGRSVLDQLRAGTARSVDKLGQVFSRIHVEDLARTVLASMERPAPRPGAIYNVVDDAPASQPEVVAYAARLLGLPPPPVVPWDEAAPGMSELARSFYAENRRVRNDRIKSELGVRLVYPSYREGLLALTLP